MIHPLKWHSHPLLIGIVRNLRPCNENRVYLA